MKWYGHLLFYLLSCALAESLLVLFFALDNVANNNPSVWANFHLPQIGLPLFGLAIWIILKCLWGAYEKAMMRIATLEILLERERRKNHENH